MQSYRKANNIHFHSWMEVGNNEISLVSECAYISIMKRENSVHITHVCTCTFTFVYIHRSPVYSIIGERKLNNNRRRMSFNEDIVPIVSLREMIRTMIAAAAVAVVS